MHTIYTNTFLIFVCILQCFICCYCLFYSFFCCDDASFSFLLNLIYVSPFSIISTHKRARSPKTYAAIILFEYFVGWLFGPSYRIRGGVYGMIFAIKFHVVLRNFDVTDADRCLCNQSISPASSLCSGGDDGGSIGEWKGGWMVEYEKAREQTWWPHLKNNKQETLGLWCHFFCLIPCSLYTHRAHERWVSFDINASSMYNKYNTHTHGCLMCASVFWCWALIFAHRVYAHNTHVLYIFYKHIILYVYYMF